MIYSLVIHFVNTKIDKKGIIKMAVVIRIYLRVDWLKCQYRIKKM